MEYQAPDFDSIKLKNAYDAELWSARELMPLLGYKQWRQFERAIQDASDAMTELGMDLNDHIAATRNAISTGKGAKREVLGYVLSRFACYMVAQNSDPRKPEVARAQAFFAVETRENQLQKLYKEQQQRLGLREKVSEGNINLSDQALRSGVRRDRMGQFHNKGYEGLYGGLDAEGIKEYKGIDGGDDLLDVASSPELAANWFRITQTQEMLRMQGVSEEEIAMRTHYEVGSEVRDAIRRIGSKLPEDLPKQPSIRPLLDERKRKSRKLAKENPTPKPDEPGQGKLF